jgi:ribosomal protein L11 methylase PrmA
LAVDEDPDASAAAAANAVRNGVTRSVRCLTGDAGAVPIADCPLVVANLLSAAHRRLTPAYGRYVAGAGTLILGGILDGEAHELAATLVDSGFVVTDARPREGWTTLVLRRR